MKLIISDILNQQELFTLCSEIVSIYDGKGPNIKTQYRRIILNIVLF